MLILEGGKRQRDRGSHVMSLFEFRSTGQTDLQPPFQALLSRLLQPSRRPIFTLERYRHE